MRKLLAVTLISLGATVSGCQMHAEKASLSSGRIGCSPQQISISEDAVTFNTASWKATCQGKTYYCVRRAYEDTNCTAAQAQPTPSQQPPPAPASAPSSMPSEAQYREIQLQNLMQQNLPYDEYQKRYRAIMGQQ